MTVNYPMRKGQKFRLNVEGGGYVEHRFERDDTVTNIEIGGNFFLIGTLLGEQIALPIVSTVVITDPKTNFPATFGGRILCAK